MNTNTAPEDLAKVLLLVYTKNDCFKFLDQAIFDHLHGMGFVEVYTPVINTMEDVGLTTKGSQYLHNYRHKLKAIDFVSKERADHFYKHNRTIGWDLVANKNGQLAIAARILSNMHISASDKRACPEGWHDEAWVKMCDKEYAERIIISAALLVAEADRQMAVVVEAKDEEE